MFSSGQERIIVLMAKIVSLFNQKGGVGKTTTAVNLCAFLAHSGKKVLGIDMDPQSNFTSGIDIDRMSLKNSAYDIMVNDIDARDVVMSTDIENLDVIPSNMDLASAEIEIAGRLKRETILKRNISSVTDRYDFVIIDCAPSLGLLPVNALCASDSVLIPIQCEYYALEGVSQLMNTINLVKKGINPYLNVEGVLLTMFDGRTNLAIQVVEEVRRFFGSKVYRTVIPRNVRLAEAPSYGMSILDYDSTSRGARAYQDFTAEFLERINGR